MAARTLAGIWVEANGGWTDSRSPLPKNEKTKRSRAALKRNKGKHLFVTCDLERIALELLEKSDRHAHNSRTFTVRKFADRALGMDVDHCIFVPLAREWQPASVNVDGVSMSAARYVCIEAYGAPKEKDHVARHLCGNGHMSCINPNHLAWGTQQQNANDRSLHFDKPMRFPEVPEDIQRAIAEDKRLANVIAVHYNIPAYIVGIIRQKLLS